MRSESRPTLLLYSFLLVSGCLLAACGTGTEPSSDPPELVAEDVGPSVEISTENDIKAAPREESLVGVMPSIFPDDLPIHLPSSLVNFGDGEGGPWVELLSSDSRSAVAAGLKRQLSASGWRITEAGEVWMLEKGDRRARLDIGEGGSGTLYRYEY